ncbi:hypothetical protein [Herbiconiux sp. L3-i23]|uniref:hypothetical protein n=1 Tax=Herbiconiux sp. L3-i23 TaxID=2905871 RepID=UPI002063D1F4|nr:hypothetical protein [Herbiconiux sp. L3-i23]BDI22889.1 hypothetical protein L3i23_16650 [Herbiconiux sp. L3-i23]
MAKKKKKNKQKSDEAEAAKRNQTPGPSPEEAREAERKKAAKAARRRADELRTAARAAEREAGDRAADFEALTEKYRKKLTRAEDALRSASERAERAKIDAEKARDEAETLAGRGHSPRPSDYTPPLPTVPEDEVESTLDAGTIDASARNDSAPSTDEPIAAPVALPLPLPDSEDEPSEAWTVVRLRALARSRGVTGSANKTKAQLLDALRS